MAEMNPQALRHMWQRVIVQALRDALNMGEVRDGQERQARREARAWLDGNTKDFDHVCTLAGFDPAVVREWWASIKGQQTKFEEAARFMRDAAARKEGKGETDGL
jgi:hypothetical protein